MPKFRKKPVVVDAVQWFKLGDHTEVRRHSRSDARGEMQRLCDHCRVTLGSHGWIDTLEGGHIVCPGDWIITGIKGEYYPCKPSIFTATYGLVK